MDCFKRGEDVVIYSNFASVYDRLMQDVPYTGWVNYLGSMFERHGIKPRQILDIGCGTGNVTIPLAEIGYRVTGLDMSPEMLSLAEKKAREKGLSINWILQDMKQMELGSACFDLVISMTDSLNYITTEAELSNVFHRVRALLNPGGHLIFDLNSLYKIQSVFGNNVYTHVDDDIAYIWDNAYNPETCSCTMDIIFFIKEKDGKYRKFTEQHRETGYTVEEVKRMLNDAGFTGIHVYGEGSFEIPQEKTERIYFVAETV